MVLLMRRDWLASLKKFFRLKVLLIQLLRVSLSVIFLLMYAKYNFASVLKEGKIQYRTAKNLKSRKT